MKTIWFTSDLHLGHENVIRYAKRPFANADEMDAALIANWKERVKPGDDVYIVGDFSFHKPARTKEILAELPGVKFLVRGNHDKGLKEGLGFAWIKDMHTVKIDDPQANRGTQRIVLCHYAMRVWDMRHHGAWHLYGHSHGNLKDDGTSKSFDIGVDGIAKFAPMSYEQVAFAMSERGNVPFDHHGDEGEERDDG